MKLYLYALTALGLSLSAVAASPPTPPSLKTLNCAVQVGYATPQIITQPVTEVSLETRPYLSANIDQTISAVRVKVIASQAWDRGQSVDAKHDDVKIQVIDGEYSAMAGSNGMGVLTNNPETDGDHAFLSYLVETGKPENWKHIQVECLLK